MNAMTPVGRTSADHFAPENENIRLWLAQERTDPNFTKPITGKSYKGTSPTPTYIVKRLTAAFGPVGWGWGYRVLGFEEIKDADAVVNLCTIEFWYYPFGRADASEQRRAVFEQVGATQFAYTASSGKRMVDEDARKKSLTDAITKAASHIGFAGDIFLGRYDDSKYIQELREEDRRAASAIAFCEADGKGERRFLNAGEWRTFWRDRLKVMAEDRAFAAAEPLFEANKAHIAAVSEQDEQTASWVANQLSRMAEAARKAEAEAETPPEEDVAREADLATVEGEREPDADEAPPEALALARSDGTVEHARAKNGVPVEQVWLSWVRARAPKAGSAEALDKWWALNGQHISAVQRHFPDVAAAASRAYTNALAQLDDSIPIPREPAMAGGR